jgi:hypothetical protein
MDTSLIDLALADLCMLTEQMLQLAEQGAWEQVAECEAQRQKKLHEYFATPSTTPISVIQDVMQKILHADSQIMEKIKFKQKDLSQALKSTKVIRNYSQHSST